MSGNNYDRNSERVSEEIRLIVNGAPPEQEKRSSYVIDQCIMLEHTGLGHPYRRKIEDEVRQQLNVPAW